jgi:hypothetical protein
MTEDIQHKLLRYSALASALTSAAAAQGQVLYTPLTPPDTVDTNEDFADIDLDQDGNPDFRIFLVDTLAAGNQIGAVYAFAYPNSGSQIAGQFGLNYPYPFKLNAFDAIDSASDFLITQAAGSLAFVIDGATPYGELWNGGVTDGFLGLKLNKTFDTAYYGWARLDIAADGRSFILKDFAMEQTANTGIGAGVMNLSQFLAENIRLWAAQGKLMVRLPENHGMNELVITDLAGRTLLEHRLEAREEDIALPESIHGLILVTVRGQAQERSFKVMVR